MSVVTADYQKFTQKQLFGVHGKISYRSGVFPVTADTE